MIDTCRCLLATTLALLLPLAAPSQEQPKRRPALQTGSVEAPLLPTGAADKLALNADQKDKIAKIEKEFADKVKGVEANVKEAIDKAKQDKDRAAFKQAQEQLEDARRTRADYEGKVTALLNAEQKTKLEAARGSGGATERRPGAAPAAGAAPLLQPAVQERLNLTPEQKEKLAALQKEFETNALKVLDNEQKQKYEQLRKGRVRPPQQEQTRTRQSLLQSSQSAIIARLARVH